MTKSEQLKNGGCRLTAILMILLLLLSTLYLPSDVFAATEQEDTASRLIYVVYDDSNSMIRTNRKPTTAWSEAKYSLEILSAMMQEKDSMSVYYMSDFQYNNNAGPRLTNLSGAESQRQNNIDKIHNTVTPTDGTPYVSIKKAYNDLKDQASSGSYDEYHLVVLTDGKTFNNGENTKDLDGLFGSAVNSGIKVVYLAIGSAAIKPTANPEGNVYVYTATPNSVGSPDSILNKVTEMGERIFQRPAYSTNGSTLELKIPVSEIVVFAQGANVNVGDLPGARKIVSSAGVTEADKDKASAHPDVSNIGGLKNVIVAEGLYGSVVTFKPSSGGYIPEGTYQLDISATSYTVYYKPCLDVSLELKDEDGMIVESGNEVDIGTYTATYFLTYPEKHPNHGKKVDLSGLGIDPAYLLTVTTNGIPTIYTGEGPMNIDLTEGATLVTVTAKYLTYISTDSSINFAVADLMQYLLRVEMTPEKQEYMLSALKGNVDGFTVKVTNEEGAALTDDEWNRCKMTIHAEGIDFTEPVKNADQTFTFRPILKNNSYKETASGDIPFTVNVTITEDKRITHKGADQGNINIYNDVIADEALGGFQVIINKITPGKIDSTNFNGVTPTAQLEIKWNGNPLTQEQYNALKLSVDMNNKGMNPQDCLITPGAVQLDPYVEGQPTTATVVFSAEGDDETLRTKLHQQDLFKVTATLNREGINNTATAEGDLKVNRIWSFMEILWLIILILLILFILFGYIICKKWLPWKITYVTGGNVWHRHPYSNISAWLTAIVPFMPVSTDIQVYYIHGRHDGDVTLRIKAAGKDRAIVQNAMELFQNDNICLDNTQNQIRRYLVSAARNNNNNTEPPVIEMRYESSHLRKGAASVAQFRPSNYVPRNR